MVSGTRNHTKTVMISTMTATAQAGRAERHNQPDAGGVESRGNEHILKNVLQWQTRRGGASCHTGKPFPPRLTEEEDAKLHGAQHGQEALAQHEGEELQAERGRWHERVSGTAGGGGRSQSRPNKVALIQLNALPCL